MRCILATVTRVIDPPATPEKRPAARRAVLADAVLAGGLAVLGVVEVWVPLSSALGGGSPLLTTVLVLWSCAWLAVRRRFPLPSHVLAVAVWPAVHVAAPPMVLFWGGFVVFGVSTYSVARHGGRRGGVVGAAVMAAALVYLDLREPALRDPGEIAFHWSVLTVAWVLGRGALERDLRTLRSESRAALAEAESARSAAEAVAEERARIAREMHDVVAHSMSVMIVQAGAAAQIVDHDPARARAALDSIRSTGTEALAEMRRLVGVLRDDGAENDLRPQPGTARVPELVEQARAVGLDVELTVEGGRRALPPGLDLTAYRIVQEALTNVRRHSRARRVEVLLRQGSDCLEIVVRDDGVGAAGGPATPPTSPVRQGHGLLGMTERATLYGGTLHTSSPPAGGFVVRAVLPLPVVSR